MRILIFIFALSLPLLGYPKSGDLNAKVSGFTFFNGSIINSTCQIDISENYPEIELEQIVYSNEKRGKNITNLLRYLFTFKGCKRYISDGVMVSFNKATSRNKDILIVKFDGNIKHHSGVVLFDHGGNLLIVNSDFEPNYQSTDDSVKFYLTAKYRVIKKQNVTLFPEVVTELLVSYQ